MKLPILFILSMLCVVECKEKHLSCKNIRAFVDGHNARRLLLAEGKVKGQPIASEMNKLIWDEELHSKAAKRAARHEKNEVHRLSYGNDKSVPSGRFSTGENLYWYSTTNLQYKLDPDSALEDWFLEHTNFTFGPLQKGHFSPGHPKIGHYTQMIWSDSTRLGCAISKTSKRGWNKFFLVCNYGPPGNFIGQTPYKTGAGAIGSLICDHKDCTRPYGYKC